MLVFDPLGFDAVSLVVWATNCHKFPKYGRISVFLD